MATRRSHPRWQATARPSADTVIFGLNGSLHLECLSSRRRRDEGDTVRRYGFNRPGGTSMGSSGQPSDTHEEFDLLVVGEINPDVIVTGPDTTPLFGQVETIIDSIRLCPGSSSVITACGAAKLGLRTAFAGAVGLDLFGSYMLAEMANRGVDVSCCVVDATSPTGVSVVLSKGDDRAILTSPGAMAMYRSEQVP